MMSALEALGHVIAWKKPSTALTQPPNSSSHDTFANPAATSSHSSGFLGSVIFTDSQHRMVSM